MRAYGRRIEVESPRQYDKGADIYEAGRGFGEPSYEGGVFPSETFG
jgi:hypothetical protein